MKTTYIWKSSIADALQQYIRLQKQTGLKFETQERCLRHFDSFHFCNGYTEPVLTKPMLHEFIYDAQERPGSHRNKEIVMKGFATYQNDRGGHSYVPVVKTVVPKSHHIPYIFSKDELARFFDAVDHYPVTPSSYRNTVDPVLFRFLYGTGARISEALKLTIGDMDLDNGVVTILGAKNNKDRFLPMEESLVSRIRLYVEGFHRFSKTDTPLFPGSGMGHMDRSTAYCHFRDYLLMADIPHTANGPKIHGFRHHFAVACLKKWVLGGSDLTSMIPYLSAYMGHSDFRGTQYYLRLTADLYPDIISRTEAEFGYVIPEGGFEHV
jgi:site-specific recombinase XerD